MPTFIIYTMFAIVVIIFIGMLLSMILWKPIIRGIFFRASKILLTDNYQENILELMPGMLHVGIHNVLENSLRSTTGAVVHRPLGSFKSWPNFDSITFISAQTSPYPISHEKEVDI